LNFANGGFLFALTSLLFAALARLFARQFGLLTAMKGKQHEIN
jgi:hypothetical protein